MEAAAGGGATVCRRERIYKMKILIVGGGGREHVIAEMIQKNKKVEKIYCAPGNAGIASIAECVPIGAMELDRLTEFAVEKEIDLCVISMDDPLVAGLADKMRSADIRTFGPSMSAARLEGSKAFAKELMEQYNIPTAKSEAFTDANKAAIHIMNTTSFPIVLKADGPALGKGVLICETKEEAFAGVYKIMMEKAFGAAGDCMIIEEYLTGPEVSVLAFCDGQTLRVMASAQDHKRSGDGNTGQNTGGMGTFSPAPQYTKEIHDRCMKEIYEPTVRAMSEKGCPFVGVIFFGLMLTQDGPKVLEYNARFGDPEAQVVLPRMKNDLLDVMEACVDQRLDGVELAFSDESAVCVVLASGGYPGAYETGFEVSGLEEAAQEAFVYHAGTKLSDGKVITAGGRVLGVTAMGESLAQARKKAYDAADKIHFSGKYMRSDIAKDK